MQAPHSLISMSGRCTMVEHPLSEVQNKNQKQSDRNMMLHCSTAEKDETENAAKTLNNFFQEVQRKNVISIGDRAKEVRDNIRSLMGSIDEKPETVPAEAEATGYEKISLRSENCGSCTSSDRREVVCISPGTMELSETERGPMSPSVKCCQHPNQVLSFSQQFRHDFLGGLLHRPKPQMLSQYVQPGYARRNHLAYPECMKALFEKVEKVRNERRMMLNLERLLGEELCLLRERAKDRMFNHKLNQTDSEEVRPIEASQTVELEKVHPIELERSTVKYYAEIKLLNQKGLNENDKVDACEGTSSQTAYAGNVFSDKELARKFESSDDKGCTNCLNSQPGLSKPLRNRSMKYAPPVVAVADCNPDAAGPSSAVDSISSFGIRREYRSVYPDLHSRGGSSVLERVNAVELRELVQRKRKRKAKSASTDKDDDYLNLIRDIDSRCTHLPNNFHNDRKARFSCCFDEISRIYGSISRLRGYEHENESFWVDAMMSCMKILCKESYEQLLNDIEKNYDPDGDAAVNQQKKLRKISAYICRVPSITPSLPKADPYIPSASSNYRPTRDDISELFSVRNLSFLFYSD
ncbi:hypothetical protein AB6A40_010904 [Gnathostoma spinigerum]|uniref:Uncharacterized protein n=1 Tax=Gnathostoma spinigerum TaxID=75299 RepID=A0ABD6F438_9BILA